ncbi:RNA polymerase sigma factor [Thiolinea disciformis]|uniref:RNA polymerase sigma factor n=1 Tax=Thiolinea disciformis TaxID=125614 RepID=UPI00035E746C|nr:sigma-70 family RNA polymerase sigma factor [Thiolinea disciformis]
MDSTTLIARVLTGDRAAFAPLVDQYQGSLFAYLGRMGFSQAQAEELAQETFIRVWQHLGDYDPKRAQFSTWLFTIAHRLALNEWDKRHHQYELAMGDDTPEAISSTLSPAEQLSTQQQQQRLQQALTRLNLADRSALALAYVQGLDLKTIAELEGCSESALKVRLHRAKQQLRTYLELS